MFLSIEIPSERQITPQGLTVKLAGRGESWSSLELAGSRHKIGVYVIHHGNRTKYVGKTDARTMDFGTRLRREFQYSAAQGEGVYAKLVKLTVPPAIKVTLLGVEILKPLVMSCDFQMTDVELIRICEQVFISAYKPEFQQGES
ncbi:MAG: hypothetical protein H8E40_16425 [Chloroflexi bacterium]|nr:hypothetical protein [Chloroflexota bacterium]